MGFFESFDASHRDRKTVWHEVHSKPDCKDKIHKGHRINFKRKRVIFCEIGIIKYNLCSSRVKGGALLFHPVK